MSFESLPLPRTAGRRLRFPNVTAIARRVLALPELLGLLAVAGVLNLWDLSINGYANTYYAAAVKAMASSWHDFLFNSMDKTGLMTVDKPPLSDWIQALSVRAFGFDSWSLLAPQAVMGIIAAGLMYDLTRRRCGRLAGFVAGFVLATTPTIVAMSRHNNPDELLVTLSVAAVWFALLAIETGRSKWLVWSGVFVGLGFETKMGVALMLVPGIALAWLWMRWDFTGGGPLATALSKANRRTVGQLLWAGLALAVVGLAWPILVTLTPAAHRPWISGTADNSVWSLIFGYNGVGRVTGQTGAPTAGGFGGGASSSFGGNTGVFRLIGDSLGSQSGWLLGAAVVAAVALIVLSRMRRSDQRAGFVLVIGVTLLITGTVFSFASGIFHPYYVSMVAPWAAALIGAGVGEALPRPLGAAGSWHSARIVGPALLAGGAITELVILHEVGELGWGIPVVIVSAVVGCVLLAVVLTLRVRAVVLAVVLAALLAAPVTWAAETLNHATSSTFPAGGPAAAETGGGFGGRAGGFGGRTGFAGHGGFSGAGRFGRRAPSAATGGGFGSGSSSTSAAGVVSRLFGGGSGATSGSGGFGAGGVFGAGSGELEAAAKYANSHGGGVVAVESQSTAAEAILAGYENVAGIGGFSGVESSVTAQWIAREAKAGRLRYLLATGLSADSDGRTGSADAFAIAESVATKVTFTYDGTTVTLYDLQGKSAAILRAAAKDPTRS